MKLHWQIDDKDVVRVKALIAGQAGSALIRARQERNLAETKPSVTKERFWRPTVSMRLTNLAWNLIDQYRQNSSAA